jgi:hypothetical protein
VEVTVVRLCSAYFWNRGHWLIWRYHSRPTSTARATTRPERKTINRN